MDQKSLPGASLGSSISSQSSVEGNARAHGSLALITEALLNMKQDGEPHKQTKTNVREGEDQEEEDEEEVEAEEMDAEEEEQEHEGGGGARQASEEKAEAAYAVEETAMEQDREEVEEKEGKEEKTGSSEVRGTTEGTGGGKAADALEASQQKSSVQEFVEVDLSDIRKDVQCPICLGIIRKTRTVMECLHRFCRECIDKSMRLGNNECPVCRTHCASRRSLRDDLNFDALIAALYPNVDAYEEEEFALREENERRNKQLQQSIAETLERQSDAMTRRCTTSKVAAATGVRKSQSQFRNVDRQNKGKMAQSHRADDEDYVEECEQPMASETVTRERRSRNRKRDTTDMQLQASNDDQGEVQQKKPSYFNEVKATDESKGETSSGNLGRLEGLATWARAGSRSTARYGNLNNSNSRLVARATMLLEALSTATQMERDIEFDVHLTLQPFSSDDYDDKLPSLDRPYICCPANVTVQHVCEFLVNRLPIDPEEELELILGSNEGQDPFTDGKMNQSKQKGAYDGEGFKVPEILHPQATLGQIHDILWHCHGNLVLLYRRRL